MQNLLSRRIIYFLCQVLLQSFIDNYHAVRAQKEEKKLIIKICKSDILPETLLLALCAEVHPMKTQHTAIAQMIIIICSNLF